MMEEIRDTRKKGWFWAENALIDREDIGAYEKLIYMTLSRFADGNGKCFPGLDLLMKKCSIGNKGTLRKHLASMEEKGLIEIVKRSGKGNIYYLKNIKDEPEPKSTSTESVQGTDLGMPKSGQSALTKNGQTPCTDLDRHPDQKWSPKETQEGNTINKTQLTKHNRVGREKYKKEKKKNEIEDFVNSLEETENYKILILEYINYRKEIKKPLKTIAPIKKLVRDFPSSTELSEAIQIAKEREWTGLEKEWVENYKKSISGGNENGNNTGTGKEKKFNKHTDYEPDYSKGFDDWN